MQVKVKSNIKYMGKYYKKDDILKVNEYAVNRYGEFFELIEEPKEEEPKEEEPKKKRVRTKKEEKD